MSNLQFIAKLLPTILAPGLVAGFLQFQAPNALGLTAICVLPSSHLSVASHSLPNWALARGKVDARRFAEISLKTRGSACDSDAS